MGRQSETVMSASPIVAALQAFETERANLLARVAKLDAIIAQTRDAFHLPARTKPAAPARATGTSETNGDALDDLPASVRQALKNGPLGSSELMDRGKVSRYLVQQFVKRGLLTAMGATASRRFSLPGAPAKEAP